MPGVDKKFLRGFELMKGSYFKRKGDTNNPLTDVPIHFVPKAQKTEAWKKSVSDYYEYIGLSKVSHSFKEIMKNRWLSSGVLDINDYKKTKVEKDFAFLKRSGLVTDYPMEPDENTDFSFFPLIPNITNLFTGYQLKRNNKFVFSLVDNFSKAELFEIKDSQFKGKLKDILFRMRDSAISGEDFDAQKAQEELIMKELEFKNYKDTSIDWANRVHKINYKRFDLRNLIKNAFKESYMNSSKVLFHINMMESDFKVEHIDEAFAFNGANPNSMNMSDSGYIGWFKWANIGDILNEFGKILNDDDIILLKSVNEAILNNKSILNLVGGFNSEVSEHGALISEDNYDTTKPFNKQPNSILEIARYKENLAKTHGIEFTNATTITQSLPDINQDFEYGRDKLFRIMYCYVESERRIGWLTKINEKGEIDYSDWITEDHIVTEEPIYDNSKNKDNTVDNLIFGEHIDWEWTSDWRRFITISPNSSHLNYGNIGANLNKIYIDGDSLPFQFKNSRTPYGVKPPIVGIEIKQRGVKAVPIVSLLKQDQVLFNICKNRVKKAIANDRGLVLAYNTNTVSRFDADNQDDGEMIANYEKSIRENKTLRMTYDKQYLAGAGGQMAAPFVLNLSTLGEALQYEELAEKMWYSALRTIGVNPQAIGEVKASEEVGNVNAATQMSQVQTEIFFDEFNNRLLPELFEKILEATQYYSTINNDFRLMYLNDNNENAWLDVTGIELLHKDFACHANYNFDNKEFSDLLKRMAFDNTLQESLLTRLKVVANADENVSKVLTILEESEQKAQEAAQAAENAKREDLQAQRLHEQELLDKEIANDNIQKDLDRKSKEYIGELGILGGGIQTDADTDGNIDSYQNFKNILQRREIDIKEKQLSETSANNNTNNLLSKKIHDDKIRLEEQKLLQKEKSDKMKLEQAVVNRNKNSKSSIDKKVLK